ncbi:MAG: type II toxin-antitoxin system HicA family toxin [Ardenticatenaceae bacterium]|nr:type II toxin-antitoxin system HicA family toxin [Ardenticatenaceae bacterium]
MKYRDVARKLYALGCEELPRRSGGSHRKWHNPANGRIAPIPDWGAKDLKLGTLRSIVRQLDLDWQEFNQA